MSSAAPFDLWLSTLTPAKVAEASLCTDEYRSIRKDLHLINVRREVEVEKRKMNSLRVQLLGRYSLSNYCLTKILPCSSLKRNESAFDPYSAAVGSVCTVRICKLHSKTR